MIARLTGWAVLAATLMGSGAAMAQTPAGPETEVPEIVVEGRRIEDMAQRFVGEVAAPPRGRGLARWHVPLCVGVANLQGDAAQYLIDRVSTVGADLGLRIGEPGCRANVVVVFSDDGPGMARGLVERERDAFDVRGGIDRGSAALRAFQTSDAPVRWWHLSIPVDTETGQRAVRLPGDDASDPITGEPMAIVVQVFAASRLRSQMRDDLNKVIIVVDVDGLEGTEFVQLADYVAFVALAQVNPDGVTEGFNTVLNLFDDPTIPGLTDWDWAYLQSLYRSGQERLDVRHQADAIAAGLIRDQRGARAADQP